MLVSILDYTGDNVTGSFTALSVVEHRRLDEYRTATLTVHPDDYIKCKDILKINQTISFVNTQSTNPKRMLYKITSLSVTEKLVTVEAEDYRVIYKTINFSKDIAGPTYAWRLSPLITAINNALTSPSAGDNFVLQDKMGLPQQTSAALTVSLSSSYDDVYVNGFEFISMSLYDAIYAIQKAFSVYLIWQARTLYFTDDPTNVISNNLLSPFRTSVNATDFSVKYDNISFKACVRPFFEKEDNNRYEKTKSLVSSGLQYNQWFKSLFPQGQGADECKKFFEIKKFQPIREWNRDIDAYVLINGHTHDTLRDRWVEYWTNLMDDNSPYLEVCNVMGKAIGHANCSASGFDSSHNSRIYKYNDEGEETTTNIGWVHYTQRTDDYYVEIFILSEYYGNYNPSVGFTPVVCGQYPSAEVKIYTPTKKELGIISNIHMVEGEYSLDFITNVDDNDKRIQYGYVQCGYAEQYSTYSAAVTSEITQQASIYINDYMPEDIKSIQATPIISDNTGIGPGMSIHIISDVYQDGDELMITSCDVDMITHRSSNVTIGWKRKMLRDLKK